MTVGEELSKVLRNSMPKAAIKNTNVVKMTINLSTLVDRALNMVLKISEGFPDPIKDAERFDGQLMKLTIISADCTIHFFTTNRSS